MAEYTSDVAFSPAVKAMQSRLGSRRTYEHVENGNGWEREITPRVARFVAARNSFYLSSATADGQPYLQHRGGPTGFLRVLDRDTIAFPDYGGNRQYISLGNLSENDRVCLFLMDYPNRHRLKIWGRACVVEDDAKFVGELSDPAYRSKPERAIVIKIEAWDFNCTQHITPRFSAAEMAAEIKGYTDRIAALEAELTELKANTAAVSTRVQRIKDG